MDKFLGDHWNTTYNTEIHYNASLKAGESHGLSLGSCEVSTD